MKKTCCLLLALVLAAGLFAGCETTPETTVSVQSVALITGYDAPGLQNRYAGVVEAGQSFGVERDEGMTVGELHVAVGDTVREGQPLFAYDTAAAKYELEKAKLEKDQMENAKKTKIDQIAQLEKDKAKASADAQIDYTLQIQELQLDVSEAEINLEAKQKEIDRLERLTENTEVVAPMAGRVQTINDPDGQNYDPAKPYITLVQTDSYRVKGTVTEQYAASLWPGMPMTVRSRTDETVVWSGVIELVDTENPISNENSGYYYSGGDGMTQTSKYPFYVALDSDDGLMLGQHVYIEPAVAEAAEGLYLPAMYLCDTDSAPYVWAANSSDRLEKRSVTLGAYDESRDSWEIVAGLAPEDYIAFPDETCVPGAGVVRYDENSFENGASFEGDAGFYEGDAGFYEGDAGFYEGDAGFYEGDAGYEGEEAVPIYNGAIVGEAGGVG